MDLNSLLTIAQKDPGLEPHEKVHLAELIRDKDVQKFLSGIGGATLAVVASKYLKLGRTAQVLLGIAGFGLGRLLYDEIEGKHRDRQFATYDNQAHAYQIDSKRY